mgnify:CR=1 FL=1
MSSQTPPAPAHSRSYADFPFDAPRHTCDEVTNASGRRYDSYLGGFLTQEGTFSLC